MTEPEELCLAFVNTVDLRRSDAVESLRAPADLAAWARGHGVLDGAGAAAVAGPGTFEMALAAREAFYRVLVAAAEDRPAPAGDLDRLNAALRAGPLAVAPGTGGLTLAVAPDGSPLDRLLGTVAHSAARLLTGSARARLRACPGSPRRPCGWLFVDTTRPGNRRYCVTAACGNRARAQRHAERRRPA